MHTYTSITTFMTHDSRDKSQPAFEQYPATYLLI